MVKISRGRIKVMQELYVLNRIVKVSGWVYIYLFAELIPGVLFKTVFKLCQGKQ